jgi:hypothetical protein
MTRRCHALFSVAPARILGTTHRALVPAVPVVEGELPVLPGPAPPALEVTSALELPPVALLVGSDAEGGGHPSTLATA